MDYLSLVQRPFIQVKQNPATKSYGAGPLDDFWYEPAKSDDEPDAADMFRAVAWAYSGVRLRANAVAAMPFAIMRGETEIDVSEDYQNKLGWLPDPRGLFYRIESSLTCFGAAYLWRERNRVATKGLRYLLPSTIEPVIDEKSGLVGWYRTINGKRSQLLPVEYITYFWQSDPWVELGPPESSPLMAALAASGVLKNLDRFAAAYFARGAIKATMLAVAGNPPAAERDRLKTWWGQFMTGVRNAFSNAVINADAVTPVVVGEGLAELSNATLTAEKRQDIAQAFGIPLTMMFSESARGLGGAGVANEDKLSFSDNIVVPECRLIEQEFNDQVFRGTGYRLVFRPETLDIYQEDETARASAYNSYTSGDGKLPPEVVGPMLGIELPAGWTWEKIAAWREERRQEMAATMQGGDASGDNSNDNDSDERTPPDNRDNLRAVDDLRKWRAKSNKRGKLAPFESDYIPAFVIEEIKAHGENGWRDAIGDMIVRYTGEDDGEETQGQEGPQVLDMEPLVKALTAATEALLREPVQPTD